MFNRTVAAFVAASFLIFQNLSARAENGMGYQLLSVDQANALPRNGGKLGLNVGRAQQIKSDEMTFELLRVNSVSAGSSGAQAGFKVGDQIIAVDGKVFPSVAAFAAYVGSKSPADKISVDYMPPNGGPKDAQRINLTLGGAGSRANSNQPQPSGLSTGTKIAIGVGAAAVFGCYELGCFKQRSTPAPARQ